MSSKNLTPEALTDFFQAGKADTDFEVQETYVTGVCTLCPDRLPDPRSTPFGSGPLWKEPVSR